MCSVQYKRASNLNKNIRFCFIDKECLQTYFQNIFTVSGVTSHINEINDYCNFHRQFEMIVENTIS